MAGNRDGSDDVIVVAISGDVIAVLVQVIKVGALRRSRHTHNSALEN